MDSMHMYVVFLTPVLVQRIDRRIGISHTFEGFLQKDRLGEFILVLGALVQYHGNIG